MRKVGFNCPNASSSGLEVIEKGERVFVNRGVVELLDGPFHGFGFVRTVGQINLDQVSNGQLLIPLSLQILRHQASVAVVWLIFAAEKTPLINELLWNRMLNLPLFH